MKITDIFSAQALASNQTEVASNRVPYLGEGLFPAQKKLGLDLKWLKANKGLAVSLAPSNFDAKSTLRSREGFTMDATEMAFFRESMLVKEQDEQEILRVQESGDPYAQEILNHIYDDTATLVEGARVVPERMRMQLLAPEVDGSPRITIEANGVQYSYNYDADGKYKTNNYTALTGTDKWSDTANADPLSDLSDAMDKVEEATGSRPATVIMSKATMNLLKKNEKLRSVVLAQNVTANIMMTDARVREVFASELGLAIAVYTKQYKDEAGVAHKFYPDGMVTLVPAGALGTTWYGTTPEERASGSINGTVATIDTGITATVTVTTDPVNTKTTVSEIVLPSYERMNETYVIKVD